MNEDQRLHLQFLQDVINRMNSNSFSIKEWMIGVNSALIAVSAATDTLRPVFLLIAVAPTFILWLLDGYYLHMERKYRSKFNKIKDDETVSLFDMDASTENGSYVEALFRPTISLLYISVIIALFVGYMVLC